jgi:hypothetical protein
MRSREHGGVLPLLLGMLLILAVAFFGATTIGRFVVARQEAQRAADATCLAYGTIIRTEGMQVLSEQQRRAEIVGRANTSLPVLFDWSVPPRETATALELTCRAVARVPAPSFIWQSGFIDAVGEAMGLAKQQTITDAEKKYPQLTLVLDYSGSMAAGMGGHTPPSQDQDSFHVLRNAAMTLLEKNYELRYGLVIFATGIRYATDNVRLGNDDIMKEKVMADWKCPYRDDGGGCMTASAAALQKAQDLLDDPALPSTEKKYVIFVSDGLPTVPRNNPQGRAREMANALWDMGVTLYTLHVINSSSVTPLRNFMISISGPPEARGVETVTNPDGTTARYYFNVDDEASMNEFFDEIGGALACSIGPLEPPPAQPDRMRVFTKGQGGRETLLHNARLSVPAANEIGDLWDDDLSFRNDDYFLYSARDNMLYVTPRVCDRVQGIGGNPPEPVVIRFSSTQIVL